MSLWDGERGHGEFVEAVVPESEAMSSSSSSQLEDSSSSSSVVYGEFGAFAGGRTPGWDKGDSGMIADGTIGDVRTTFVREMGDDEEGENWKSRGFLKEEDSPRRETW